MRPAEYLTEHPGVYCLAKETIDRWLSKVPEQVGDYLQVMYKMEGAGIRKKYLKTLYQTALG